MSILEAIVLGVVQGLTEFLPVSSSAHLIVLPWLFGWEEPGLAFDAALHLGNLTATLAYFWRDLLAILRALPCALRRPRALLRDLDPGLGWDAAALDAHLNARLALLIAVGTVPGLLAGFFGQDAIERFFHDDGPSDRAIVTSALLLIFLGALLWVAERGAAHHRRVAHLTWRDAVSIGLAQATALLPGISRSGATITAGLFQGLHRADAARFAFLLGLPLTTAAAAKAVWDAAAAGMSAADVQAYAAGGLAAAAVGFLAIWRLLRYLQRSSFTPFVLYRLALGLLLLFLVAAGVR